jgi:hypothetical protein
MPLWVCSGSPPLGVDVEVQQFRAGASEHDVQRFHAAEQESVAVQFLALVIRFWRAASTAFCTELLEARPSDGKRQAHPGT